MAIGRDRQTNLDTFQQASFTHIVAVLPIFEVACVGFPEEEVGLRVLVPADVWIYWCAQVAVPAGAVHLEEAFFHRCLPRGAERPVCYVGGGCVDAAVGCNDLPRVYAVAHGRQRPAANRKRKSEEDQDYSALGNVHRRDQHCDGCFKVSATINKS